MTKPTISDTPYGKGLDLVKRGVEAATFLAKNRASILGLDGAEYLQSTVKLTVSTPLIELFDKAAQMGKLKCFTMFDLSGATDVPTLLTLEDVSIDGKYIAKNMPSAFQNAWLNLTPILSRRDAYNRNLQLADPIRFANLVAKGILCMSYNDSENWMDAGLHIRIIEAYSLLFAMHLKNMFNLDMEEYNLVRTLFAAYMAQMLDPPRAKEDIPSILYRCKFLYQDSGTPKVIDERFDKIAEVRNKLDPTGAFSTAVICGILAEVGPSRMKNFNERTLYVLMSRSPMDSQNMMFAMDYPPYFVYLLLNNVRGGKNPLFMNLLKFGNFKAQIQKFADDLVKSKYIIERVQR